VAIHDLILQQVELALEDALINNVDPEDPALAGAVKIGSLQGNPDPDQARVSVEIYENDPDPFWGTSGTTAMKDNWDDEIRFIECGGSATWLRRFTIKARALLVNTGENEAEARAIGSTLRSRIEDTLLNLTLQGVKASDGEYVSRGVLSDQLKGEMIRGGGPPDAFDYYIKVRFSVETTRGVQP
jgi:hypothetical protein